MDDEQAIRDAHAAQRELYMTERAFDGLRKVMLDEIVASPIQAVQLREKLYLAAQTLDAVRKALHEAVSAGEVANYRTTLAEQISLRPN